MKRPVPVRVLELSRMLVLALVAVLVASLAGMTSASASEPTAPDELAVEGQQPVRPPCANPLVAVLERAGFTGEDLREAWSIAMRESRGLSIGPGHRLFNGRDYGIFQFNRPTFGRQSWWHPVKLMNPDYSARIAHKLSKGGTDWVLWGLDGQGRPRPELYRQHGWTAAQVSAWIVEPYQRFYRTYPC